MIHHRVPQPSPDRMAPVPGAPLVVGVSPGQPELVALTAAAWSDALGREEAGAVPLYFGYADPDRVVEDEFADGSVRHVDLDPDRADDSWQDRELRIREFLGRTLASHAGPWEFRYLAGRPDRALTHLARAVGASAIVVGARHPSAAERLREFFAESVALHLTRHQHRPVIIVPLAVVDWRAPAPW
jgi:nucleotide-binding universal stress UspA family protein